MVELPREINEAIKIVVEFSSWDYRTYEIHPSGKVLVCEHEIFPPNKVDVGSLLVAKAVSVSHRHSRESYEEVVEAFRSCSGKVVVKS